jgi:hypothetical protein
MCHIRFTISTHSEGIQLNKLNTCCIKEKGQTGTV